MRPLGRNTARLLPLALFLLSASVRAADVVEYYHTDGIGDVRVVTDAAGNVVERHDYLPFGEEWCGTAVCSANRAPGEPLRFTGKERDAETGLDYFGARYYRANTGRFTTVDPTMNVKASLADPQRWNRYAYGRDNPLRYVDPDGKQATVAVHCHRCGPPPPLPAGAGAWQQILHFVGVASWALAGGGVIPGPNIIAAPEAAAAGLVSAAASAAETAAAETETAVVQRVMSRAELAATEETGLLRGGREGIHHVTDAASTDALRARQRLSLLQTPEVRTTMEVPASAVSLPRRVGPAFNMPGGGVERTATGSVPAKILRVDGMK